MIALAERLADDPDRPVAIVTWRFNRFARNLLDAQFYKAALRRSGYVVVSMADDIPQGDFAFVVESLLDWKAEHDLAQMSGDIRRAFAELRAQGYRPGGFPPRGLKVERQEIGQRKSGQPKLGLRWIADEILAPMVAQAFTMRSEGASYAAILRGPLRGVYKSTSCLSTFFANRNYVSAGVVSPGLFEQVQAVQLRSKRKEGQAHPRRVSSPFLLSGLLACRCGGQMIGETQQGRWRYYRCNRQKRERTGECTQSKIRADRLEEPILDAILSCVLTPERIEELAQAVNDELNADDGLEAEAARLRQQVAEVEATINRLLDALEREGLESVRERLKAREAERRKLRGDLALVEAEIAARRPVLLTAQEIADLLGELRQHREAEDTLELRAILRLVIECVTVDGESHQVHYRPEARPWFTT
jgi:hypothetical protein